MKAWTRVTIALLAFILLPFAVAGDRFDSLVSDSFTAYSGLALALLLVACLVADVVLPIPSSLVASYACQRFGPGWGLLIISTGISCAMLVGYFIGRSLGTSGTERSLGPHAYQQALHFGTTRRAAMAIALSRALPVFAEAVALLAGALRWPVLSCFLWSTLAGLGVGSVYALLFWWWGDTAGLTEIVLGAALVPALGLALSAWMFKRPHPHRPTVPDKTISSS